MSVTQFDKWSKRLSESTITEIQEWVFARAQTVPGSQGSPSYLLPLCLVLDHSLSLSLLGWLYYVSSQKPSLASHPDTWQGYWHLLCAPACPCAYHHQNAYHMVYTSGFPARLWTSQSSWILFPFLGISIHPSLFHQPENSASDKSHPPGRCLWPS